MNNDPIKFAMQDWNFEYNWWHPNTVPLNFLYNEEKRLPATQDFQWFNHQQTSVKRKFNNADLFQCKPHEWDYLMYYKSCQYVSLSSINENEKYIYPVTLRSFNYFINHKNIGFKYVSDRVVNDVKNNKAKIVIIYPIEGNSGNGCWSEDFEILNSWCNEKGFKKEQVYFIHGNHKVTERMLNYNFTYIPIQAFLGTIKTELNDILEYTPTDNKNLFLTYNRRWDYSRAVLMCELIAADIFNRGLVSYLGIGANAEVYRREYTDKDYTRFLLKKDEMGNRRLLPNMTDLDEAAKILDNIKPLTLDVTDLEHNNPVTYINNKHHMLTFLFITTETATLPGTIFFSEKTWKPILAGQPFILVSSQHALKELKNQGYQTFSKWWSEDYDNHDNINVRIKMIVEELVKLNKLSTQQLIDMRKEMKTVLKHNQDLFIKRRNEDCDYNVKANNPEYLYKVIKNIWDSF
jgi:hypothetical protein